MRPDHADNLRRLIGEAVALGAESVSPVSQAEVDLVATVDPILPTPSRLSEVRELIAEGSDPLGEDFCGIFSAVARRSSGATYTPSEIVDAMVGWALDG